MPQALRRLKFSEIVTSTKFFFVASMLFARSDVFPFLSRLAIPKVIDGNLQFKLVVSQYGTLFGLSQQRLVCRDVLLCNIQRGSIISFYNEVFPSPWWLANASSPQGPNAADQDIRARPVSIQF
jgi:hypothetical protein